MARSGRLKRRTQHERLGELPNKTKLWGQLFPIDEKESGIFNIIRPRIEERASFQEKEQKIGIIREEKVLSALELLKKSKKIKDFIRTRKFSKLDLIDGIDFEIIYISKRYNLLKFSVTGKKWVEEHRKRHPDIPVLVVFLKESINSVRAKILRLLDRRSRLC